MAIRVDVNSLSDEVRESLERGEVVEIERDGEVVGRLEPGARPGTLGRLAEELAKLGPPDENFTDDLRRIRESGNAPIGPTPWES